MTLVTTNSVTAAMVTFVTSMQGLLHAALLVRTGTETDQVKR